ncbi:MAG: MarR family transcriptional regulator [Sphingobacteriales bacterium]|jgi:DNA-binding MarR family transcriptional regulator|nr:MarR family transcriptional regulator [Sphingobacteriales bacterium]
MPGIEEAIRQRQFSDHYEKAVVNILFTASYLDSILLKRLKPYGISPQQFNVLRILRGAFPTALRLGDITERMLDKNSNATRLVDKLIRKEFVRREVCKHNRRQVDIWITEKGLDLLAALDIDQATYLRSAVKLDAQDVDQINNLLDRLRG